MRSPNRFETFYFSKIKSLFNNEYNKEYIKEAWEQWYHKSYDYLQLKKFPKNFNCSIDFAIKIKEKSIKKLSKINIKFDKINLLNSL